MKNTLIIVLGVIIIALVAFVFLRTPAAPTDTVEPTDTGTPVATTPNVAPSEVTPTPEPPTPKDDEPTSVIGSSIEERDITAYHFGSGDTEVLFVGGIHGGYSWNTALVAYELISYLEKNPTAIPATVRVTVIPALNPDGLFKVTRKMGSFTRADVTMTGNDTIPARFNARTVDLNRNFDCDWRTSGTWQSRQVSGGSATFSEPESQALRDYVTESKPSAVVVWYSAAGGVYASNCYNGVLPETTTLTNLYAKASGYPAYEEFNYYEITGDAVNWLAKSGIPAISVLLTSHTDTEWEKNRKGIEAILSHYAE